MIDGLRAWLERPALAPRRAIVALLAGALGCAGSASLRDGWPPERVAELSPPLRASYERFAQRCSRCHTLSRPLGAGIADAEHWRLYVGRMRRTTGSGISAADAEQILLFLEHHAGLVRARRAQGDPLAGRLDRDQAAPSPPEAPPEPAEGTP